MGSDDFQLTKTEILEFLDRIIEKWENDDKKNLQDILAINAVRTSATWTNKKSLEEIWKEILQWSFEIVYKNTIKEMKEDHIELGSMKKSEKPNTKADINSEWF